MSFLLVAAAAEDGQISTAYFSGQDLYRNSGGDLLCHLSQTPQHYDPSMPEVPAVARSLDPDPKVLALLHPLNCLSKRNKYIDREAIIAGETMVAASGSPSDPAVVAGTRYCLAGIHGAAIVPDYESVLDESVDP